MKDIKIHVGESENEFQKNFQRKAIYKNNDKIKKFFF